MRKKFKLTVKQKKNIPGYIFTLPFTIGFILFFLFPFFQSLIFSLSQLELTRTGFSLRYIGLENFNYSLFVSPRFVRLLVETIMRMASNVPLILIFSFLMAVILNQKFRGRGLARVIFFLPVIMGAGIILRMEQQDLATQLINHGIGHSGSFLSGAVIREYIMQLRLPESFLEYILYAIDRTPFIIRASGVQILIFLSGLQSISPSLYEASKVEGATGWENFWLITLPMMSPIILTNAVYTIVDSFISPENRLLTLILETTFSGAGYGVSTAMAWLYFIVIMIILGITIRIISKGVFYHD